VASGLVVHLQTCGSTGSAVSIGVLGAVVICMIIIWPMVQIARAQEAADILGQEQEFLGRSAKATQKKRVAANYRLRASFPHPTRLRLRY